MKAERDDTALSRGMTDCIRSPDPFPERLPPSKTHRLGSGLPRLVNHDEIMSAARLWVKPEALNASIESRLAFLLKLWNKYRALRDSLNTLSVELNS